MIPVKIKALNQDSSDESNVEDEENPITKEALEQKLQLGYREALLLQKQNKLKDAENILFQLIKSDVLHDAEGKVKFVNRRLQPSIFHLKYCCYLNLGNISFKMERYEQALKYYSLATELDDTDLNLWYKIGNVAMKIPNLMFAVSAFTETLYRNPQHWPSLNSVITATYALGDMMACLLFIHQGLSLDGKYKKGSIFKERIFTEHPHIKEDFYSLYPHIDNEPIRIEFHDEDGHKCFQEVEELINKDRTLNTTLYGVKNQEIPARTLLKPLTHYSWVCLGKSFLKLYKYFYNGDSNDMIFFSNINLKSTSDENSLRKDNVANVIPIVDALVESAITCKEKSLCDRVNDSYKRECEGIAEKNVVSMDNHESVFVSNESDPQNQGSSNDDIDNICSNEPNPDDDNDDESDILKELTTVSSKADENEKTISETSNRTKRRKCSPTLADQLKLCDKRRSTRNKTVLKSNEPSLSKVLKNLIPRDLLPQKQAICKSSYFELMRWNDDSFDTMDIYRLLFEHQDQNNLPSCPVNEVTEQMRNKMLLEENYFGSEKETSDIDWYINMYSEQPILELMEAYLKELAKKWSFMWPTTLTSIFLEMCRILQKHGRTLQIFTKSEMNALDDESSKLLKDNLLLILMYGELLLDEYFEDPNKGQPLAGSIFGGNFSSLLIGEMHDVCNVLNIIETDVELWMRTCWLEAMLFLQKKNSYAASSALSMIVEETSDSEIEIRLPNVRQFYLISQTSARRLLNTLIRNENLNQVKHLIVDKQFRRVIEILENTLKPDCQQLMQIPNESTLSRYQQYTILLTALSETKCYEELFEWCEVCCYESFAVYRKSFFDEIDTEMKSKWASLVMNTLNGMLWCLKNVGLSILKTLKDEHLIRLVQTLCSLVCHQIEASDPIPEITTSTVTPWILLCNIVRFKEKDLGIIDDDGDDNDDDKNYSEVVISSSVSLLFVAHEYLGKRCWCCFEDGALLFYTLDVIENMYKRSIIFSETWQTLAQQIDQIFYCLYSHPFKRNKPRHVQEHNSLGLALTWNRAVQAYCFYRPTQLPMFDAVSKQCTISADTETLLKRMIPLIPDEQNPARFLDCVNQFTNNVIDEIPINENLLQSEVKDIFYLLGDYYFKNKIMGKAIKYYSLDVCFDRRRFDSWAAMALARGSQLEMRLNSCETIKNESDILKKADLTDKCYKTALELDANQPTLWIEYGVFCYSIHGFCSRLLKQETTTLSLQMFDTLENRKNEFLKTSFRCFNSANDAWVEMTKKHVDVQDERWLHHYMLGKIAEKNDEKIDVYLNHYLKALQLLHQNGAEYPLRILYSSPQYYSVEALEIYYRIHATILKLLETHEEKPLDEFVADTLLDTTNQLSECDFIKATLSRSENGGNGKFYENLLFEKNAEERENEEPIQSVENDVRRLLEEVLTSIVNNENVESMPPTKRKIGPGVDLSDGSSMIKKLRTDGEFDSSVEKWNFQKSDCSESAAHMQIIVDDDLSSAYENEGRKKDNAEKLVHSNNVKKEVDRKNVHRLVTDKCIAALEECVRRFPEHYKSYYRLANHYFRSKSDKNIEKARKYLLQDGGLFADRKMSNFFSGIWRIPTGEIDRSGSFAFHMSRSIHLMVDVLRDTQDHKMLLSLSIQLRDMPELDKKYIRDNEREQICREALSLSVQTLRKHVDNLSPTENEENKRKLLLEVYKCYQRISKFYSQKDVPFGKILLSAFSKYTNRKDKINVEQILSFCKNLNSISKEMWSTALSSLQFKDNNCKTVAAKFNDVAGNSQTANFTLSSDTKMQSNSNSRKVSNECRVNYHALPNNLKNLPPAITVTTVSKTKNTTTNPPVLLWNQNNVSTKCSSDEEKKYKAVDSKNKLDVLTKAIFEGRQADRPHPKSTTSNAKEKANLKVKRLLASDKNNAQIPVPVPVPVSTMAPDKGLTITPIISKDTKNVSSVTHTTKLIAPVVTSCSLSSKPSSSAHTSANVEVSSLFITPVDAAKNQPTLQQKLAAKQLANITPSSKNSTNISVSKHGNLLDHTVSFDVSKNLGSSGVSIFPLPLSDSGSSIKKSTAFGGCRSNNAGHTITASIPATFQNPQPMFISKVNNSSSSIPDKKFTPSFVVNAKKLKHSETVEIVDYKNYNNNLSSNSANTSETTDTKLKNALKALEESSNIIITPKMTNKSEPEVITLE